MSTRIAVFASGGGSNLQSLLDTLPATQGSVGLVVSNRRDAGALQRAQAAGVHAAHIATRGRTGDDVAREMLALLREHDIELIALAGYLQLIPPAITAEFRGRIVNIHPSLLPAFGGPGMFGTHVHTAVLRAGCRVTGATVHHVDDRYDEGAIIAQWPVPVLPGDDVATLAARVLGVEHRLYPLALRALIAHLRGHGATPITTGEVFRMHGTLDGVDPEMCAIMESS